jgi:hypothetical protein
MSDNVDMNKLVETIKATIHDMHHSEDFPVRVASISQFQHTSEAWIIQLLEERERLQSELSDYELLIDCLESEMSTDAHLKARTNYELQSTKFDKAGDE